MRPTREIFEQQCKRRFGTTNPERMRLECWEWMVRYGGSPYPIREELGLEMNYPECGPDGCILPNEPDWCFSRFGTTRTIMPDGRIIRVGGEHEDWYDPDFCIYNDVIVLRPAPGKEAVDLESGEVEIYGYPESVFPPTDFHSATLTRERLFLIGRLGYSGTRMRGVTPILSMNPSTYAIEQVLATGPAPGWVYRHHASYDEATHAIVIRGGMIHIGASKQETTHFGAHRLHLDGMRWEVISLKETHRRFLIEREAALVSGDKYVEATAASFRPNNVPYRSLPSEDHGVEVHGLDVQGVRVTFENFVVQARVLIEGSLPPEVVDQILKDVIANLQQETKSYWSVKEVQSFEW